MARKKYRDDIAVTVHIPKKLLIEYATERVSPFQPESSCRKYVKFLFSKALFEQYLKIVNAGGDANDSGERGATV